MRAQLDAYKKLISNILTHGRVGARDRMCLVLLTPGIAWGYVLEFTCFSIEIDSCRNLNLEDVKDEIAPRD